jgi:hypothetical protein
VSQNRNDSPRVPCWNQLEMETAIEIALCCNDKAPGRKPNEDEVDEAGGISQWIQARATEFEQQHCNTDWDDHGSYYEAVEDWVIAYNVAQRMK